jgi:rhamnulokinase
VLLEAAAAVTEPIGLFDADDASLLPPGEMPARIEALLRAADQPIPSTPAGLVRSILESLALAYARTLATAARITGDEPEVVHMVGGGSQNTLLCQLTADRTGLPVLAGPVEATAMGNLLVQARSFGAVGETLEELRELVARTHPPKVYRPRD